MFQVAPNAFPNDPGPRKRVTLLVAKGRFRNVSWPNLVRAIGMDFLETSLRSIDGRIYSPLFPYPACYSFGIAADKDGWELGYQDAKSSSG
jgi:hypothetical protein